MKVVVTKFHGSLWQFDMKINQTVPDRFAQWDG